MAKLGEHAVVLGASMAGLGAARALAEFFDTVTVVERDALSDNADHRRGVPQGRQIHGLLLSGAQALEELFPGILDELVAAGAPSVDYRDLSRLHFNMGGHLAVQSGSAAGLRSLRAYTPSRAFLESHIRRRVRAIRNIAFGDLSLPEIQGTPPLSTRVFNGYMDRLLTAAEYDTAALEQFLKVAWLVDAPIRLLRPSMMWRAASANHRRQKRRTPVTATSP